MTRKMTTKNEQKNEQENDQRNGQESGPRNQPPKAAGNGPLRTRTRVNRRSDQDRRPERTKGVEGPLSLPWAPWPVRRCGWLIYGSAIRIRAKSRQVSNL
jgi:hypothetical protein